MFIFQSMNHVSLFIALTVFLIISVVQKQSPFTSIGIFFSQAFSSGKYVLHLIAVIAILFLNKIELRVEDLYKFHNDFTPWVYRIEGHLVAWIQQSFEHNSLTWILTYFYIVVFPALMIASIGVYTSQRNLNIFYMFCYAIILNYLVATPFYLFLQVNEVWFYPPADVKSLIPVAFPTFEQEYRPLSGLDNCFPSLHTSISITVAVIASRSGSRIWSWLAWIIAVIIIFSIFYLGIHWFTDMLGGILLAVVSLKLAGFISGRIAKKAHLP
ncbi:MAG TPA: phosphatase PAP2 family protein [Bacilli bacterium]